MSQGYMIDGGLLVAVEPGEWIDSDTGQPIGDGARGHCYLRVRVADEVVLATARAICLAELGDPVMHGDARCCQAGGQFGCCLAEYLPVARAAITAYNQATGQHHDHQHDCGDGQGDQGCSTGGSGPAALGTAPVAGGLAGTRVEEGGDQL